MKSQLPKDISDKIIEEDKILNRIIEECGGEYTGTDPLVDAKRVKREQVFKGHKARKQDVFDQFGHGVTSYFRFLRTLIITFTAISIFVIPTIYQYGKGHTFESNVLLKYTLGNLGQTESKCYH